MKRTLFTTALVFVCFAICGTSPVRAERDNSRERLGRRATELSERLDRAEARCRDERCKEMASRARSYIVEAERALARPRYSFSRSDGEKAAQSLDKAMEIIEGMEGPTGEGERALPDFGVGSPPPAAAAPSCRAQRTVYSYLFPDDKLEKMDSALYSVVIFYNYDPQDQDYLKRSRRIVTSILARSDELPRSPSQDYLCNVNVLYFPLVKNPGAPPEKREELIDWILKNYDYDRARLMVNRLSEYTNKMAESEPGYLKKKGLEKEAELLKNGRHFIFTCASYDSARMEYQGGLLVWSMDSYSYEELDQCLKCYIDHIRESDWMEEPTLVCNAVKNAFRSIGKVAKIYSWLFKSDESKGPEAGSEG